MVELEIAVRCVSCGTGLSQEGRSAGLCPGCLLELALDDTSVEAELGAEVGEAPTLQFTPDLSFSEGQVQGDRYRIRSLLGRGGMGEVWRAYDLKLRQDVALKALRTELIRNPEALETLRQEVRVAREVISPNVCRVFDLQEVDGQELVSMEYIDGTTLQEILRERGPLDLNEAREIASQFLAGLEAIHEADLVHRDIKPENIMVTRTGRVVVMDFGIAKGLGDGRSGVVAGTPAYMSPEQASGAELDAGADVFSTGVVLAEMVEPEGVHSFDDRKRVWEGIHRERIQLAETPWSQVIAKAVAADPGGRFASASELARALEEVTLRAGDETAQPYPGLMAFQQEDAEFFYGRELEVEALWKKLRRPHLLGVIGPSGAGKSSFLRAGLLPTLPEGWRAIVAIPGNRPFGNLARALAPELGDAPGTADLLRRFEDPGVAIELFSEWRRAHEQVLVIVDQFEELFTQSPPGAQEDLAELLSRLPLEADVHVLLSMRDDFLFHCQTLGSLAPVFSEITPLGPPTGASLRRAIVQPALKCGYRFEDEGIVEEMLAEVEGERGALPMVAFAAAQLWERRDRDTGLLTRKSYEQIGGVGGALAQHAEATLERIGDNGIPIVRELFRNLVTAQGTRAARDREELLSVFGDLPTTKAGTEAGHYKPTVDALIDARLLTSYEVPVADEDDAPHHRIEIVHESLLANWPRLVRWQMQDAEGAKLRDELRSQAKLWSEHDRSQDYLWIGAAYLDFLAWKARYPGGLTKIEDEFCGAMTRHAERQRQRRRYALAATIAILLAVLAIVTWSRFEAVAEARRSEASRLLALGQLRQDDDPTEALAYTMASLELADSEAARVYAVRLLWEAPPALELDPGGSQHADLAFSPDFRRLSVAGFTENVRVWTDEGETGEPPAVLPGHAFGPIGENRARWMSSTRLVTGHSSQDFARVWSFPGGRLEKSVELGGPAGWWTYGDRLFAEVPETDAITGNELYHLRSLDLPDGELRELGTVDRTALGSTWSFIDLSGTKWIYGKANSILYHRLPLTDRSQARYVGSQENRIFRVEQTEPGLVWTRDTVSGELCKWNLTGDEPTLEEVFPPVPDAPQGRVPDPSGRWAVYRFWSRSDREARVWDLRSWPEARPLTLRRSGSWYTAFFRFHPLGSWLVVTTQSTSRLTFWPLEGARPHVADGYSGLARPIAFSPDGQWVATVWGPGDQETEIRLWPLPGNPNREMRLLELPTAAVWAALAFESTGRFLVVTGTSDLGYMVPLDGSPPRQQEQFSDATMVSAAAVSPSGRLVATAFSFGQGDKTLRVWDLDTDELRLFDLPESSYTAQTGHAQGVWSLAFADETTIYTAGDGGVRRWSLETGVHELVFATKPGFGASMDLGADGQTALVQGFRFGVPEGDPPTVLDLATGEAQPLPAFGGSVLASYPAISLDISGMVAASGDTEGIIRVGRIEGGRPHLLIGHEGAVEAVAISPDGRWIASTGDDNTLRLWPMPDLDKPPLHTLPRDELIAKLKSLTNIRVVRDPESPEGWKVTLDPFPGWREVPTWQ